MSTTLSNRDQLRWVEEWFGEWSEMQRTDFLEILAERCGPLSSVNGLTLLVDGMSCKEETDRPPSLFQIRVKLFDEWSQNWSQQEKDGLVSSIKNMDPKFGEKYDQRLTVENESSFRYK